jgi:8-oxo-dGTP pyrophosphatase MutT (NUDIX family)
MPSTPEITVAAVVAVDDRFLCVEERINHRLVFNQPAGHVEPGESLLTAVVREVQEETAWVFRPEALLGVYLWRRPTARRATLRFAFIGSVSGHDATQRLDRGIVCTHWLSQAQLSERAGRLRSPLVLRCIEDFLAGSRSALSPVGELDLQGAAAVAPSVQL